jgi:50S ribosomal protein L16 3-hydroxylase
MPGFRSPLSPEELAGLACEADVESRLVVERGARSPWELRRGPFTAGDFGALPAEGWTLLVQDVDKHLPELAWILSAFDFLPAWRRDDLMVSYAPEGGSVGPHVDGYDVFLLQGLGRRRWELDAAPAELSWVPGTELAVLRDFHARQQFELEPGDALYLPPGAAHHGVALEPCMTFSIGFRAPSAQELAAAWAEFVAERMPTDARYADPDLEPSEVEGGLLPPRAVARARALLGSLGAAATESELTEWLGRLVTEPKAWLTPEPAHRPAPAAVLRRLRAGDALRRHGMALFARARVDRTAWLFANGRSWDCDARLWPVVSLLAESAVLSADSLAGLLDDPAVPALLAELLAAGALEWRAEADLA